MRTLQLIALAFMALGARADVIFYDATDSFEFSDWNRMQFSGPAVGHNTITIYGPGTDLRTDPTFPTFSDETIVATTGWDAVIDAGDGTVGDILYFVGARPGDRTVDIGFRSHWYGGGLGPCGDVWGDCNVMSTGDEQIGGTITWSDGTVDTIRFVAQFNPVPEPSTLLLLATVCIGLAGFRRVRLSTLPIDAQQNRIRGRESISHI